jgi:predicted nucleic acid-binding protein
MSFWDSSAVIPLIVSEPTSAEMMRLLQDERAQVVWWGTQVECASALCRLEREALLATEQLNESLARLDTLRGAWSEVAPTQPLAEQARRLLRFHALRAADALQLSAALAAASDDPASLPFVSLDRRLRDAAVREGFPLAPAILA